MKSTIFASKTTQLKREQVADRRCESTVQDGPIHTPDARRNYARNVSGITPCAPCVETEILSLVWFHTSHQENMFVQRLRLLRKVELSVHVHRAHTSGTKLIGVVPLITAARVRDNFGNTTVCNQGFSGDALPFWVRK